MSTLADRLQEYILHTGTVSMTQLLERSKGRYTSEEMRKALATGHKQKVIKKAIKGTEVWYSKREAPKPRSTILQEPRERTEEERAGSSDFWEHSPLVTDEERECHHNRWKGERCKWLLMTTHERERFLMKKHGPKAQQKIQEELYA